MIFFVGEIRTELDGTVALVSAVIDALESLDSL